MFMIGNEIEFYLEIPVNDTILMAMIDTLQDLLDAMRRVRFTVELPGDDVFEQFPAGYSVEQQ